MKLKNVEAFESIRNTVAAFIGTLLWDTETGEMSPAERETCYRLADILMEQLEKVIFEQASPERLDA